MRLDVRQDHTIYQLEIHIIRGVGRFSPPLPNNLHTLTPKDGWVPLAIFSGGRQDAEEESCEKESNNRRGDTEALMDRARTEFCFHQFNTLRRLNEDDVDAELRLVPFER